MRKMLLVGVSVLLMAAPVSHAATAWKDAVWLKAGREPNLYYSAEYTLSEGGILRVYAMRNLPESDLLVSARSEVTDLQGDCTKKVFTIMGTAYFSGENSTGVVVDSFLSDLRIRKMAPVSEFYAVFKATCGRAK